MNTEDMPVYRCHKKVRAARIVGVVTVLSHHKFTPPEGCEEVCVPTLFLGGPGCAGESIEVSAEFIRKHNPEPGGYLVVYDDGYRSFSPARAFEEGYVLEN